MLNYFQIFGFNLNFKINLVELDRKYFVQTTIYQKNNDINNLKLINLAYLTLRDDFLRIIHILKLNDIEIEKQSNNLVDIDILETIFDQIEQINSNSNVNDLDNLITSRSQEKVNLIEKIAELLETDRKDKYLMIVPDVLYIKYIENLLTQAKLQIKQIKRNL